MNHTPRILIVANHYRVCAGRYIADAFTRVGCDVKHIGASPRLQDAWGVAEISGGHRWIPDDGLIGDFPEWQPDLIVITDTALTGYAHTQYNDAPCVIWTVDNHVRNVRGVYDHYFLAHAHGQAQPVMQPDETWLPCGFDPAVFTPSKIAWKDREFDIALIGVKYPRRTKLIEALSAAGLSTFYATGLVYEECQKAYANARISLCVSAAGDVAQRIFETAAVGCHILSDLLLDMLDETTGHALHLPGMSFYQDDDNCVERALELIRNPVSNAEAEQATKHLQRIVWREHTWDDRARVVLRWLAGHQGRETKPAFSLPVGQKITRDVEVVPVIMQPLDMNAELDRAEYPMLNLGCGKTHLPSEPPAGHEMVSPALYQYPRWVNVDKVDGVGADCEFDLFTYPWPLENDSYDGALAAHIVEHVPHSLNIDFNGSYYTSSVPAEFKTRRARELKHLQDGWYAWWAELYRVLRHGALVHVIAPHGHSDGAGVDPTHRRRIFANTFTHGLQSGEGGTFKYNTACNFEVLFIGHRITEPFQNLVPMPGDSPEAVQSKEAQLNLAMMLYNNVAYDLYAVLRAVKE